MENCSKRIPYSTGLKFGHAPAKFAQRVGVLSEKQQYLCFSQVPAGSDCPPFRPVLYEIESRRTTFSISLLISIPLLFFFEGLANVFDIL